MEKRDRFISSTDLSPMVEEMSRRIDKEMEKIFFPPCEPWCLATPEEIEDWLEHHLDLEKDSLEKFVKERIDGRALSLMGSEDFVALELSKRELNKILDSLFTSGSILFIHIFLRPPFLHNLLSFHCF